MFRELSHGFIEKFGLKRLGIGKLNIQVFNGKI